MKKLILLFILVSITAHARYGATMMSNKMKYGKPGSTWEEKDKDYGNVTKCQYSKNGITITATYNKRKKCVHIIYNAQNLTSDQGMTLLKKNCPRVKWKLVDTYKFNGIEVKKYISEDNKIEARVHKNGILIKSLAEKKTRKENFT